MGEKYAAFISYRHLDMEVAKRLHQQIERYRIPKELRKNGQKYIGKVFRDKDELPLTNDLTQDIYDALDNSEFLIVICTPETPKSLWVQREIEHFISVHGRNRVLVVLAAGTMEESVPEQITTVYAEDGTVLDHIEPLCADFVNEDPESLESEFLRVMAKLLECPFDTLKQRHKRYQAQQLARAVGAVAAVALVIIGLLVWWNLDITAKNEEISGLNIQIQQQLEQTQLNESKALALLSQSQLSEGDRLSAIESALNALEGERPYYAPAELALANSLYVYQEQEYRNVLSIEEPGYEHVVGVSDCGHYVIIDNCEYMWLLDMATGEEIWRVSAPSSYLDRRIYIDAELEYVLLLDPDEVYICSFHTGEVLYALSEYYQYIEPVAASKDASKVVINLWKENKTVVFDVETAQEMQLGISDVWAADADFSGDGRYLFFETHLELNNLLVIDLQENTVWQESIPGGIYKQICLPSGELLLLSDPVEDRYQLYRVKLERAELVGEVTFEESPEQLLASDSYLYCVYKDKIQIFSLQDCTPLDMIELDGQHLGRYCGDTAYLDDQQELIIARDDGLYRVLPESGQFVQIYKSKTEIARVQYNKGLFSVAFLEDPTISFLRICGDENETWVEEREKSAKVYADFDQGVLTLKGYAEDSSLSIQCPFDLVDELYVHRTFSERFELTYSVGVAEMYYERNGIYIVCYYEGGYQDVGWGDFDTPEAYAIYSADQDQWNWFTDEALDDASMGVFFMNEAPGFAIVSGTNTFKIYDFVSNSITLEMQVPLTYLSGIQFSSDDRYALAFDNTRYQSVLIDLSDGTILETISYGVDIFNDCSITVTADRIFMAAATPDGDQSYGIIVNREEHEVVAMIPDMGYYDGGTNQIVLSYGLAYPAYSTQDLIAMGKDILAGNR